MSVVKAHSEAVGMGLAMVVVAGVSLAVLPVTLLVVAVVRSQEVIPRLIHWVGRKTKRGWAQ